MVTRQKLKTLERGISRIEDSYPDSGNGNRGLNFREYDRAQAIWFPVGYVTHNCASAPRGMSGATIADPINQLVVLNREAFTDRTLDIIHTGYRFSWADAISGKHQVETPLDIAVTNGALTHMQEIHGEHALLIYWADVLNMPTCAECGQSFSAQIFTPVAECWQLDEFFRDFHNGFAI